VTTDISYYHKGDNAALIRKVIDLGLIKGSDEILDATYGSGSWWKGLTCFDITSNDLYNGDANHAYDFRAFPEAWEDGFDVVAYDPPYKLNGTGGEADERYGCNDKVTVNDRKTLILQGFRGCSEVLRPGGYMLVKVQDQVAGGHVHWLTFDLMTIAPAYRLTLVDRFDMPPARPQPANRRQVHARRGSTLMVFKKGK